MLQLLFEGGVMWWEEGRQGEVMDRVKAEHMEDMVALSRHVMLLVDTYVQSHLKVNTCMLRIV